MPQVKIQLVKALDIHELHYFPIQHLMDYLDIAKATYLVVKFNHSLHNQPKSVMVKAEVISPNIDMQSLFVTVSLYLYQPIQIENTVDNRLSEDTKATFPIETA